MDRRLSKDQTAAELKFKDRGDTKKYRNKIKVDIEVQVSNKYLENDRGDSPNKTGKAVESNTIEPKSNLSKEKPITRVAQNRNNVSEKVDRTRSDIKSLDITKKRKLAQLYTFRWNVDNTSTLGLKNENQQNNGLKKNESQQTIGLKKNESQQTNGLKKNENLQNNGLKKNESQQNNWLKKNENQQNNWLNKNENQQNNGLKKNEIQQNKGGVEQASRADVVVGNPRTKTEHRNAEYRSHTIQEHTKDHIDQHAEISLDRKPVIKTVTCKNDAARIYKAVTFVDKKRNVAALKIDIPRKSGTSSGTPPKSGSPLSERSSSIKENKEKSSNRSLKGKRKRIISPELAGKQPVLTEVAKWAPLSVNQLTQPYYEAWVDTTLTAFSRPSESEKLSLARHAFENIRTVPITTVEQENALDDWTDEKYTGKIKVTHKISKR